MEKFYFCGKTEKLSNSSKLLNFFIFPVIWVSDHVRQCFLWFILPENVDFVENSYLCRYVLLPYRTKKTHRRTSEKSGMQNVVTDRTWVGLFADTSFCISKIGYISGSVRNSVTKFWHITRESMSCPKVWKSEFWKNCSYVLLHRCRRYAYLNQMNHLFIDNIHQIHAY